MQFIYGSAPISYIKNIPKNKAGEWSGSLPYKFRSYKRVIRTIDSNIFFLGSEPLPEQKKRQIKKRTPSAEYIFRPCIKKLNVPGSIKKDKKEGKRCVDMVFHCNKLYNEKKHFFDYIEDKKKKEKYIDNNKNNNSIVKEEFNLMSIIGFSKKPYIGIPNNKLKNRSYINNIEYDTDKIKFNKNNKIYIKNKDKYNSIYNSIKDIKYVKNLDNWEKNIFNKK